MKYKITYQGKEIEIERLPNGKFKIPPLGQFTKHGLGSTWLDEGRIPYENDGDIAGWNKENFVGGETSAGFLDKLNNQSSPKSNQGRFPANLCCSSGIDVNIEALLEAKHKLDNGCIPVV